MTDAWPWKIFHGNQAVAVGVTRKTTWLAQKRHTVGWDGWNIFHSLTSVFPMVGLQACRENASGWTTENVVSLQKCHLCWLDCPSSKGNHAPPQKFEKPNGKNTKSKFFFKLVQNWCPLSHLKALWSDFFEDLNRIKTNQNKWKSMTFLIVLHLKPKTLLY